MDTLDQKVIEQIDALSGILSGLQDRALYGPARFWETISQKHTRLIAEYGFRAFKRTLNFEYHQWGVRSFNDEKTKRLFRGLLCRGKLPFDLFTLRVDTDEMLHIRWPDSIDPGTGSVAMEQRARLRRRIYAYTLYIGLLWQFARCEDKLNTLGLCQEPELGCPLPITRKGKLISQDLATSSLELNRIAQHVDMSEVRRIAEIGSGYGRLAYMVRKVFPHVEYCIFDIPPALAIAQNYLALTLGQDEVRMFEEQPAGVENGRPGVRAFLPNQLNLFPDDHFDLMINISSLDEMSPAQVHNYLAVIEKKCNGWLYLKGYAQSRSPGLRLGLDEFPYRETWKIIHSGADPVVPPFVEKVIRLEKKSNN
jgi:putative sugar O-methyltransferase